MNDAEFIKATALSEAQDFAEALPLWEKLAQRLSARPKKSQQDLLFTCLISLGECLSELERYNEAAKIMKKAIRLGKELGEANLYIPQSELAWLLNESGEKEEAIQLYNIALATADEEYCFYIHMQLGELFLHTDFPTAVRAWQSAMQIGIAMNDQEKIFLATEKLVTFQQARELLQSAIDAGEQGVDLLADSPWIIEARMQLAAAYVHAGKSVEASGELDNIEAELDKWLNELEEESWTYWMNIWLLRGNILLRTKGSQFAEPLYEKALTLAQQNDLQTAASVTYDIAVNYLYLEQYKMAEQYLQEAIKNGASTDYELVQQSALGQLAALYYTLGKYREAIEIQEELLEKERANEDWSSYAATINNLAASYRQVGNLREAQSLYAETGELAAKLGPMDQVLFLRNTGNISSFWGDHEKALTYFKNAIIVAKENELSGQLPVLQEDIGMTYYAQGLYEKALTQLQPLESNEMYLAQPSRQLSLYNLLGIIHDELDQDVQAEYYLKKALEVVQTHELEVSLPTVYNNLGVFYFQAKRFGEAEPLLLNALQMDEQLGQFSQLSIDHHNVGLLYHDKKNYSKALTHFKEAIRIKEQLRSQGDDAQRMLYLDQEYNTYELLVDSLVRLGQEEEALRTLEQYKNRELLGKLGGQPQAVDLGFDEIRSLLPESTAMIVLCNSNSNDLVAFGFNGSNHKTAIISLETYFSGQYPGSNNFQSEKDIANWEFGHKPSFNNLLPQLILQKRRPGTATSEKLAALIQYYRKRISRDPRLWSENKIGTDREIGAFFYRLLFSNFESIMKVSRQLILVPDGLLGLLPFDTLVDSGGKYMAEHYSLQLVPSIAVWRHLLEKPAVVNQGAILAMGISDYQGIETDTQQPDSITLPNLTDIKQRALEPGNKQSLYLELGIRSWQNLPFAELEINTLQSLFSNRMDILKGAPLSPSAINDLTASGRLRQYDILHIATHAMTLPILPELSALVLYPPGQGGDPYLVLPDVEHLDLDNSLTFLSACETALGKLYSGDGTVSLTNAFLIAGSRNVISTLWAIHDEHTMLFVKTFYEHLLYYTIPEALALTKKQCIEGKFGHELKKSIFWSAFVLWGAQSQ